MGNLDQINKLVNINSIYSLPNILNININKNIFNFINDKFEFIKIMMKLCLLKMYQSVIFIEF